LWHELPQSVAQTRVRSLDISTHLVSYRGILQRATLVRRRSAMTVPLPGALGPMRRLATELAAARGALDVGFLVTVTPKARLDLRVRKDGLEVDSAINRPTA
jgi:hypothetical protein